MTSALADRIHQHLGQVAALRAARQADPVLGAWVTALKAYQSQRFARTYADLLAEPRYQAATQFFLQELYGPQEFAERDTQFGRVVPALVRLFPKEVVGTVEQLGELHALSESLDDAGARWLRMWRGAGVGMGMDPRMDVRVDALAYAQAWQATGRADARERQIALTQSIGQALDGFTRSRVLRTSLRLMRAPAQAAGLAALQRFLEAGFDAFAAMRGADPFLGWVGDRERALAAALFDSRALPLLSRGRPAADLAPGLAALAQLP